MKKKEISKRVQNFYNKNPFPDYDLNRFNNRDDLKEAMYPFAKYLDRIIPEGVDIIDVGGGVGSLSAFLSLNNRHVLGIDFSQASISKALELKKKLKLKNVDYKLMDIFNINIEKKFDYVFCTGVLHHTKDPYLGFTHLCKLAKKNGFIVVGLYNKYGRLQLKFRKFLLKIFRENKRLKDYFIRMQIGYLTDKKRTESWYQDQYKNPHESIHTIGEVLEWFRKNNIEFISSIPQISLFDEFSIQFQNLFFKREIDTSRFKRILVQLKWFFIKNKEGGYFLMVGRKIK